MAEIKWVKLTTDMFDNRKIKHLRRLPEGNNIVLLWVMLLTMAGRCNSGGMIFLTENIPYTSKMLADELGFEENTVKLALTTLEQLNMIVTDHGFFAIAGWEEYQNIEGMDKIREQNRLRQKKWYDNKKSLTSPNVKPNVRMTQPNATEEDIEEEKELEKKKKDKKDKKSEEEKDREELKLKVCELLGKHDYSLFTEGTPQLQQAVISFVEFRAGIKKPMTEHAIDLLIGKLKRMTSDRWEQVEIINQSIMNGWQGIFPLKDQQQPRQQYRKQTKADELQDAYSMMAEWSQDGS